MLTRTRVIVITLSVLLLAVIGFGSAGFLVSAVQHQQLVRSYVDDIARTESISLSPERYQDLPEPVQRYFRFAFAGRDSIEVASVHWQETGEFLLPVGEFSIRASQDSLVDSPTYVWHGLYTTGFGLPIIDSRDAYMPGRHNMRAKLLGYRTVMQTDYRQPEDLEALHSYLALRYFGTAPAFPWALLPGQYHRWEAHSNEQAWLVLDHEHLEGHYLVTFGENGRITQMETPGSMMHGNFSWLREVGRKLDYEQINGLMVPTRYDYRWYDEEGALDSHYQFAQHNLTYTQ
jgi:hypothetical protein